MTRAAGIMRGPILWPCDFSSAVPGSIAVAARLASRHDTEVVGLHVIASTLPPSGGFHSLPNPALLRPGLHDEMTRGLERAVEPARSAMVATTALVVEGKPADEILRVADAIGAGMIVVGTHDRAVVDRAVLGSVAEDVLRRARCPVLAVPPSFEAGPAWPRLVVWATDFSPDAELAMRYAAAIAARAGAALLALHVNEGASDPAREHAAGTRLRAALGRIGDGPASMETRVVTGRPVREVLRESRRHGADLIVLGASGAGGLRRRILGSTAHGVARDAACPVLGVRQR